MKNIKKIKKYTMYYMLLLFAISSKLFSSKIMASEKNSEKGNTSEEESFSELNADAQIEKNFQSIAELDILDNTREEEIFLAAYLAYRNTLLNQNDSFTKILQQWKEDRQAKGLSNLNKKSVSNKDNEIVELDSKEVSLSSNFDLFYDCCLLHQLIEGIGSQAKEEQAVGEKELLQAIEVGNLVHFINCCSPYVKIYFIDIFEKNLQEQRLENFWFQLNRSNKQKNPQDQNWQEYLENKKKFISLGSVIASIRKDRVYDVLEDAEEKNEPIEEQQFEILEAEEIDIDIGLLENSDQIDANELKNKKIKLENCYIQAWYDLEHEKFNKEKFIAMHQKSIPEMMQKLIKHKYDQLKEREKIIEKLPLVCFEEYTKWKQKKLELSVPEKIANVATKGVKKFYCFVRECVKQNRACNQYGNAMYKFIYQNNEPIKPITELEKTVVFEIESEEGNIGVDFEAYEEFLVLKKDILDKYSVLLLQWQQDMQKYEEHMTAIETDLEDKYKKKQEDKLEQEKNATEKQIEEERQQDIFYQTNEIINWEKLNEIMILSEVAKGKDFSQDSYRIAVDILNTIREKADFITYLRDTVFKNVSADKQEGLISILIKDMYWLQSPISNVIQKIVLQALRDDALMQDMYQKSMIYRFEQLLIHVLSKKSEVKDDFVKAVFDLFVKEDFRSKQLFEKLKQAPFKNQIKNQIANQSLAHILLSVIKWQKKLEWNVDDCVFLLKNQEQPMVKKYIINFCFEDIFYQKISSNNAACKEYANLLVGSIWEYIKKNLMEKEVDDIKRWVSLLYEANKEGLLKILKNLEKELKELKELSEQKKSGNNKINRQILFIEACRSLQNDEIKEIIKNIHKYIQKYQTSLPADDKDEKISFADLNFGADDELDSHLNEKIKNWSNICILFDQKKTSKELNNEQKKLLEEEKTFLKSLGEENLLDHLINDLLKKENNTIDYLFLEHGYLRSLLEQYYKNAIEKNDNPKKIKILFLIGLLSEQCTACGFLYQDESEKILLNFDDNNKNGNILLDYFALLTEHGLNNECDDDVLLRIKEYCESFIKKNYVASSLGLLIKPGSDKANKLKDYCLELFKKDFQESIENKNFGMNFLKTLFLNYNPQEICYYKYIASNANSSYKKNICYKFIQCQLDQGIFSRTIEYNREILLNIEKILNMKFSSLDEQFEETERLRDECCQRLKAFNEKCKKKSSMLPVFIFLSVNLITGLRLLLSSGFNISTIINGLKKNIIYYLLLEGVLGSVACLWTYVFVYCHNKKFLELDNSFIIKQTDLDPNIKENDVCNDWENLKKKLGIEEKKNNFIKELHSSVRNQTCKNDLNAFIEDFPRRIKDGTSDNLVSKKDIEMVKVLFFHKQYKENEYVNICLHLKNIFKNRKNSQDCSEHMIREKSDTKIEEIE